MKQIDHKKILSFFESKKALFVVVAFTGFLSLMWNHHSAEKKDTQVNPSVDTYIPAGFVLVPIEVQNYEALDSILGPHGFVDLFLPSTQSQRGERVASRVRILRAPQNPSQFAVLVREDESERLVRTESAFFVVVQNSKHSGTGIVKDDPPLKRKVKSRVIAEAE